MFVSSSYLLLFASASPPLSSYSLLLLLLSSSSPPLLLLSSSPPPLSLPSSQPTALNRFVSLDSSVPVGLAPAKIDLSGLAVDAATGRTPLTFGPMIPHFDYVDFDKAKSRADLGVGSDASSPLHSLFEVTSESLYDFPSESQDASILTGLYDKYCRSSCRNYIAIVPNRGHRVGPFLLEWHIAFSLAQQHNLTFLHVPITPNQRERYLFERFFGLGEGEEYHYRELCLAGFNGRPCRAFMPCLDVHLVAVEETDMSPIHIDKLDALAKGRCNVVFHLPERAPHKDDIGWNEMRRRFQEARKKYPIALQFDKNDINVAIHVVVNETLISNSWITQGEKSLNAPSPLSNVISLIRQVNDALVSVFPGQVIRFSVFSSAMAISLIELRELSGDVNLVLRLDDPEPLSMLHMIESDLFIASDTDISQVCAKLRPVDRGVVLWPGKDPKKMMSHFVSYEEGVAIDVNTVKMAMKERINKQNKKE